MTFAFISTLATDGLGKLFVQDGVGVYQISADGTLSVLLSLASYPQTGKAAKGPASNLTTVQGLVLSAGTLYFYGEYRNTHGSNNPNAATTDSTLVAYSLSANTYDVTGGTLTSKPFPDSTPPTILLAMNAGIFYFGMAEDNRVFRVAGSSPQLFAGHLTGPWADDGLNASEVVAGKPTQVVRDSKGNFYFADTGHNRIVRLAPSGIVATVAGTGSAVPSGDGGPAVAAGFELNRLSVPAAGLAIDEADRLYFSTTNSVKKIDTSTGLISTVYGGGPVSGSRADSGTAIGQPCLWMGGIGYGGNGILYLAELDRVLKVSLSTGQFSVFAGITGKNGISSGDGGPAVSATLGIPFDVTTDASGNVYIADPGAGLIRKVDSRGIISTLAGQGSSQTEGAAASDTVFVKPYGVAFDNRTGNLYVSDGAGNRVRRIDPAGRVYTVAGNGTQVYGGDGGPAALSTVNWPVHLFLDPATSNLFIADSGSNRVRVVSSLIVTTFGITGRITAAGKPLSGITVSLTGSSTSSATTAADGSYSFPVLTPGGNYTLTPSSAVYTFSPASASFRNLLTPQLADFTGTALPPPVITPGGIGPVFSASTRIQPGSWISIFGTNLASTAATWKGDFPQVLAGTSVSVNGKPAYIWYVSPTQINLQAPDDTATGPVSVVVTSPTGSATATVTLAPQGPSFSLLDGKHIAAIIPRTNGSGAYGGGTYDIGGPTGSSLGYATVAARPGDVVVLFGVGFGPTNPAVPAGKPFSGAAPAQTPVSVTIGGVPAPVSFAGLVSAGLYQINLTIPAVSAGDQTVVASVGDVSTPAGSLLTVAGTAATSTIQLDLSNAFNVTGIYSDGATFPQNGGLDGGGYAFSASTLPAQIIWNNSSFKLGSANVPDAVWGATIPVTPGRFTRLSILATGIEGGGAAQGFLIGYTDGSSVSFSRSVSDWFVFQGNPGEAIAATVPYRIVANGTKDSRNFNIYGYSFVLDGNKSVSSISLPKSRNVVVLAATIAP